MATKKAPARKSAKAAAAKAAPAPSAAATDDSGLYRVSKPYKSAKTVRVEHLPPEFSRADLEFIGVDHSGPSYEARVFVNNPKADASTPRDEAGGYAGSFFIFGHGQCFGDVGHCEVTREPDEFDPRPTHPLAPIKKVVVATDAIKRAAAQGTDIEVTVIPVVMSWTEGSDLADVLKFDHINLVTYD